MNKYYEEAVGSQDQIAASYGGLIKSTLKKNNFKRIKKITTKNLKLLNNNLLLIYTGIRRTAHFVYFRTFDNKLKNEKNEIKKIISFVDTAESILKSILQVIFGELLNESWQYKKKR